MRKRSAEAMLQRNYRVGAGRRGQRRRRGRGTTAVSGARRTLPICLGNVTSSSSVGHDDGTGIEFPRVAVQHELSRNVERTAPHVVIIGLADWASIMGEIDDSMTERGVLKQGVRKVAVGPFYAPFLKLSVNFKKHSESTPVELEDAQPPQL